MSRTITVSDELYDRLEEAAHVRGLAEVEQLIEEWQSSEDELRSRRDIVRQIDGLRERLFATYGEMPDSAELVREDRDRH